MANTRNAVNREPQHDTDADRYPEVVPTLRRIISEAELPEGPVERIEITFLASGEGTYRVWGARDDEPLGGYLAPQ